jgi:hypothetical protein
MYNRGKYLFATAGLNWNSATVKALLVGTGYTPDADHNFVSDVSASEYSGTNYTSGFAGSGRKTLSGKLVTEDDTNDRAVCDCDDLTWTSIGSGSEVVAYVVFYLQGTSDADSALIYCADPANVTTIGGDVTYAVPATGLFYLG